jgi:hypothetical protein
MTGGRPTPTSTRAHPVPDGVVAYSLRDLVAYFLRLGTVGFGGPIALVGYMQRDLVEERRWISLKDYKEGLALAQLAACSAPRWWRSRSSCRRS